jgi:hypothetical protein
LWCTVLIAVSVIAFSSRAVALPGGISGFSGKSGTTCTSCHSTGTPPSVTLTGPTTVASGSTNSYTLTNTGGGNGGLDVAASAGTFTAGTGTQVLNGEITQTSPDVNATHSWTFSWTAPTVTANTTVTIFAASVNGFGGGTGTLQQAITVTAPVPAPTINVTPASLSFSYQSGGTVPAAQNLAISSSGTAFSYTVSTSATWLAASPASGNSPGTVAVSVNPSGLAAGTYTGTVSITASSASNSPKTVGVTLTVTAPAPAPTINVSPASLSFSYQSGGTTPAAQNLAVSSSGTGFSYTVSTSAVWLLASPVSGSTPGTVAVSVNPSGLAAGTYTGSVSITASGTSNSSKTVGVTLTVTAAALPSLTATPASLSFSYQLGGSTLAAQNVSVASSGSAVSYTVSTSATWLLAAPASGATPGSVAVSVNPTGLSAGTYSGAVSLTSSGASNSPVKIAVTLTVTGTPPTTNPSLIITPGILSFAYPAGPYAYGSQNLAISSSGSALNFTAAASGGAWLSVSPATGTTSATVKVSVNAAGLAAGAYNGTVTVTSSGASNSPQQVPVKLVIGSGGTGTGHLRVYPSRGVYFDYQSGGVDPAPKTIQVTSTGSPISFTATTLGGTWVSLTPSGGTTPAKLSVSVSAVGLASGTYSASIKLTPSGSTAITVPVVLRVASGDDDGGSGGGSDDGVTSTGTGTSTGSVSGSGEDGLHAWAYAYDPAGTNTVAASWIDAIGAATTTPADSRKQGLLLSKTTSASNQAQAGVVIRNVEGITLTELGFDMRTGGQCTATSPRFVVVTSDGVVHKIGCSTGTSQPAPATGWTRLRFDPTNPAQTSPVIAAGSRVKSLHLVLDSGPETGSSMVVLDNIDVNGTLIGKQ